jgi:ElaB/YqjD/DUF883 family membrane-anchored ribosome-binding protein
MNARAVREQREDQVKEGSVMTEGVERVMRAAAQVSDLGQQAAAHVSDLGQQASRIRAAAGDAVSEAIEDGKVAARRAVKRGYNRAEDLIDEATYRVKRSPLQSVALGACAGFLVGAVLIRLLRK